MVIFNFNTERQRGDVDEILLQDATGENYDSVQWPEAVALSDFDSCNHLLPFLMSVLAVSLEERTYSGYYGLLYGNFSTVRCWRLRERCPLNTEFFTRCVPLHRRIPQMGGYVTRESLRICYVTSWTTSAFQNWRLHLRMPLRHFVRYTIAPMKERSCDWPTVYVRYLAGGKALTWMQQLFVVQNRNGRLNEEGGRIEKCRSPKKIPRKNCKTGKDPTQFFFNWVLKTKLSLSAR